MRFAHSMRLTLVIVGLTVVYLGLALTAALISWS